VHSAATSFHLPPVIWTSIGSDGGVFTSRRKESAVAPNSILSRANQQETKLSTHSKMVETRRRREKNKKRTARIAKHDEKLKKQSVKGGSGADAAKKANP
jgi:hypothetical protein